MVASSSLGTAEPLQIMYTRSDLGPRRPMRWQKSMVFPVCVSGRHFPLHVTSGLTMTANSIGFVEFNSNMIVLSSSLWFRLNVYGDEIRVRQRR
ncbi:hypothetical protein RRG08_015050 [Elysia crispata]|uniref:Uncharacterized protein n=1 Tax=Elysia crispata TaxID=231223 RepID=A0AAE1EBN1_9GAST|nr:hypothetical protein RRG08_015050 [Elysia crispata]